MVKNLLIYNVALQQMKFYWHIFYAICIKEGKIFLMFCPDLFKLKNMEYASNELPRSLTYPGRQE
jgi:hypothetical protein